MVAIETIWQVWTVSLWHSFHHIEPWSLPVLSLLFIHLFSSSSLRDLHHCLFLLRRCLKWTCSGPRLCMLQVPFYHSEGTICSTWALTPSFIRENTWGSAYFSLIEVKPKIWDWRHLRKQKFSCKHGELCHRTEDAQAVSAPAINLKMSKTFFFVCQWCGISRVVFFLTRTAAPFSVFMSLWVDSRYLIPLPIYPTHKHTCRESEIEGDLHRRG